MQNQPTLYEEDRMYEISPQDAPPRRLWSPVSLVVIFFLWLILQIGGLFNPGLLDDVDSIYIEIAREMLKRHDFVTPYIDGVRFFDKPPLMYWMAAGSMRIFGVHDWAARLPLALAVLALLLAVYALGIRCFATISPAGNPDRGGFYAAIAVATSIGPYLYTRFYIPDILIALWMTLAVHLFLIALNRIQPSSLSSEPRQSALLPCLAFAAVMAANVLTKGLIGLVFSIGFVLLYLAFTKQLHLLPKFHLVPSTLVFLALAAPWHILAALRTPPIPLPPNLGLPASGGWAWFYLYNEHIARFLSKRIPHDYGQTPIWLFWLLNALWTIPWAVFLPSALVDCIGVLRDRAKHTFLERETSISLIAWIVVVLGFFTLSSRQEYYGLPALPALTLIIGGFLAHADNRLRVDAESYQRSALRWSAFTLIPLSLFISSICTYFAFTAPTAPPGTDIASLLSANPEFYNLSLGHIFDLTGEAMGLFRGPLIAVAVSMLALGPLSHLLRRSGRNYLANLVVSAAMIVTLLSAHEGLVRFYPILGSKDLAVAINRAGIQPNDKIIVDGELSSGSSLIFYTHNQIHLVHGNVNGLWYGDFWPDAPHILESEESLHKLWQSSTRVFLMTYDPNRITDLDRYAPVQKLAFSGGKILISNKP